MKLMKKQILTFVSTAVFVVMQCMLPVYAQSAFIIKQISINGLHRLSKATVLSYLTVKRGQMFTPSKSALTLKQLYQTGFFEKIELAENEQTLIINVVERPTIGELKVRGNSVIPTDKLNSVLKSLDIAEGRIYNPLVLERIKLSLINQYQQLARYNATVDITTRPMSRNRLFVQIAINEGKVAKIKHISMVGNHAFSEKTLLKASELTTSGLFTYFTQTDRYSEERLHAAQEKIRNYYLNHGYLRVQVTYAKSALSHDQQSATLVIQIVEGPRYTVSQINIKGTENPQKIAAYRQLISIQPGEIFSREKVIHAQHAISKQLGKQGYLFAEINIQPYLDEKSHQVKLIFIINPGKRTYIRHITFSDNNRTNEVVLRREVVQMEAAPASTTQLEESKHKLSLLPFLKDVEMTVNPVPGTSNQADANFKVKEDNSAQATFKVGYSQIYGPIIGAGLTQKNVLGTGNNLVVNLQHSKSEQYYGIDYTDPYYTMDGISRTVNFSISRMDPGAVRGVGNAFTANEYNAGVLYGFPIGQEEGVYNRFLAGLSYQNFLINLRHNTTVYSVPNQIATFVNDHGRHFQEADFKLGLTRDSRDKAIFPTRGASQSLVVDLYAPLGKQSLFFYTLGYHAKWYIPLNQQFIILNKANFGYGLGGSGAKSYPFFKNFYAGGIDSVRGYSGYTLGPRDSNGKAFGGNMLADASVGLIFPNFVSDNLRTMVYVDGGNAYSSIDQKMYGGLSRNAGSFRYSFGLEVDWMTPFGPIELSLAKPINPRGSKPKGSGNGDEREAFQFALGASF